MAKVAQLTQVTPSLGGGVGERVLLTFFKSNDNRAANVQRLAAIVSEREQALPATSILSNARKSVGSGSVFSLSFRSFLSLFFATKEKEKDIKKTFLFQRPLTFSSLLR